MAADKPAAPRDEVAEGNPAEHHESILLDEPTTADLRVKVTEAWQEFARALAEQLRGLPTGTQIALTLDPTASGTGDAVYSVSIEIGEDDRIDLRAVGNTALPQGYRLDRAAIADMIALGWSPPGVVEGSGGHFGMRASTTEAGRLATTVSRTLRDVYGAPHPAFLVFLVHDESDEPVAVEPLGTARPEVAADPTADLDLDLDEALAAARAAQSGNDALALEDRVRTVVSAMLKSSADQLQVDSDGDIGIRAGSAMVFVRVRDNPPLVDVFSPVLTEVEPTEQLYVKLSELTNRMPIGRLYCTNDTVWASIPVFGRNFQPTHLMLAVQVMTGLADELDDRLHGEFGGRRFFGEGDKAQHRETGEHRTGMYL
ncbi:hypothetical protein [Plantactinospora sp. BB1]|uniref:T3SS (YopN, CesT) and YbjN peptide-binding chaperone 1 n=1 Tax=Plantactinospora sp. BB1 TaxID=2071627 RepID=UPI000D162560|nr:hypothetical protein [Plantactinospora sp. BB1]AVT40044.1 hypothetical protein C6W10_30460 [Plantactinospora sp. BB1]